MGSQETLCKHFLPMGPKPPEDHKEFCHPYIHLGGLPAHHAFALALPTSATITLIAPSEHSNTGNSLLSTNNHIVSSCSACYLFPSLQATSYIRSTKRKQTSTNGTIASLGPTTIFAAALLNGVPTKFFHPTSMQPSCALPHRPTAIQIGLPLELGPCSMVQTFRVLLGAMVLCLQMQHVHILARF